ncbi:MAG: histidinol-phosphatase HisJ family protein [Oscillospiraceae bacterium]|nr:histidinol-phosphatase HisJ family protein [Oscillospiraceae bacterium]
MSMILSSAHVHTTFCDGKTTAEDMAEAAFVKGFVSLGFTSHAPQTFDFAHCIAPGREAGYKAAIRRIQQQYSGRMAVYLGMERDLYSCADTNDYDYFIASVHYFRTPDGSYSGVDAQSDVMRRYVDEYCGGDGLVMASRYFELLRDYVVSTDPAIIGHFDLVRYNNGILHLYDEESPVYRKMALDALHDMRKTHALLEVNTGGVARGYMKAPYPAPFLLKVWKEWGGEVIIDSDCHHKKHIDTGYDMAEELLLSLGYVHVVRLSRDPAKGMWERVKIGK